MTDIQLDILNHCLDSKLYHSDLVKLILNLPRDDAQQLTEFVRCLVDGVICQQLLPRLFEAQETIVDVKLRFRPDVRTEKNATHYAVLAVMNDEYDEWQMLDRPVY